MTTAPSTDSLQTTMKQLTGRGIILRYAEIHRHSICIWMNILSIWLL